MMMRRLSIRALTYPAIHEFECKPIGYIQSIQ